MAPHPNANAILEDLVDAPNRLVRYPLARAMLPLAMKTPITPNQITAIHAAVGIVSAVLIARGSRSELVVAFVLAELRMVLDCLDGVVARAKKLFSPNGRTIDEMGDSVGYVAMQVGVYFHLKKHHPEASNVALVVIAIAIPGLMALGYDFYKRKFTAALVSGTDTIADDLVKREVEFRRKGGGVVVRFGRIVDHLQLVFFSPRTRPLVRARVEAELEGREHGKGPLDEVQGIREAADRGELKRVLQCVAWMTGDNAVTILNVCILVGAIVWVDWIVVFGGLSLLVLGSVACQTFLRRVTARVCEAAKGAE